jgi:hypothetical protein
MVWAGWHTTSLPLSYFAAARRLRRGWNCCASQRQGDYRICIEGVSGIMRSK